MWNWIKALFWKAGAVPVNGTQAAIDGFSLRRNPFEGGTAEWRTWNEKWVGHHERSQWCNGQTSTDCHCRSDGHLKRQIPQEDKRASE
jgi:hypothetical protein